MAIKLIIFDLDQTLIDETIYPDVEKILEILNKNHIHMAIASYNSHAKWFCDRYEISKYFDIIRGYYLPAGKMQHISEILTYYNENNINFDHREIAFFDDDPGHIKNISNLTNINCVKVGLGGVSLEMISKIF